MRPKTRISAIADVHNLYSAWDNVRKAKDASKGINGVSISDFGHKRRHHIEAIRRKLLGRTYEFSKLVPFPKEKGQGSYRPLSIPTVSDRVVMRATYNVILADFRDLSNDCSFAYLPGRKLEDAVERIQKLHALGNTYVLEADIRKFFDSVDRDKLVALLRARFADDGRLLELLTRAVHVALGDQSHLTEEQQAVFPGPGVGIPQGGGLSPLFANLYLLPLDEAMLSKGFGMVRWADDFVVLTEDPEGAEQAYRLAQQVLQELGLTLHPMEDSAECKTRIRRYSRGFDFLGLRFDPEGVRPAREKVNAFNTRVSTIVTSSANVRELLRDLNFYISGWRGAYKFCDPGVSRSMWRNLDDVVAEHLRRAMARFGVSLAGDVSPADLFGTLGIRQISAPW